MMKLKDKLIEIPFALTGMGLFRVWTETVYSNGSVVFPSQVGTGFGFATFNLIAAATLIVFVLLSRKISTLFDKRWAAPVTGVCLVVSACLNFFSIYFPAFASPLGAVGALLGGIGIALILLLWSELFSCLNPLRVGLYFSGGLIVGAVVLWVFKGLAIPWLWACVCAIPIISLECLRRAYKTLPDNERPHSAWGERKLPWKPIAIVVLYSFSYGLSENLFNATLSIHSGLGCVVAALMVYLAICWQREDFSFSFTYKVACPFMIISLAPFAHFFPFGGHISAFFALAGYTLVLIAIMVVLSNLCYQYGFNAIWLFGIERAARLLSVQAGISVKSLWVPAFQISTVDSILISGSIAVMILIATRMFLLEATLTSSWGAVLRSVDTAEVEHDEKFRLGEKCSQIAREYDLTAREEEVLVLIMQNKKPAQIEQELYIANSTVKTHLKHLYTKLDVHSRQQLFELMGVEVS